MSGDARDDGVEPTLVSRSPSVVVETSGALACALELASRAV